MAFAFVFPGQGSQSLKMIDGIWGLDVVQNVFATAHKVLGIDFLAMLKEGRQDDINQTVNTQPLMLCAGYATYLAWMELIQKEPNILAGHSLGEWTALVASGVIKFEDALNLVRRRAEFMQGAVKPGEGAMVAVLGLDDDTVVRVCDEIQKSHGGIIAGVNFNSPGQVVVAGDKHSVDIAMIDLKVAGAKRVQMLPVSVPSHCLLMKPAADKLLIEMNKVQFNTPKIKVLHNVDVMAHTDVTEIKNALVKQLYFPVRWTDTIEEIVSEGITNIVECGPAKVLSGLNKRINSEIVSYHLHSVEDIKNSSIGII